MADTSINIDEHLDLSGEVCPYTFVRTKLALEKLPAGAVLEVTLDNAESASNVPRSAEQEGHEVLSLEKADKAWKLTLKKA